MDRLREALAEVSVVDPGEDIYNPMVGPVRSLVDEPIVRAARVVADAETVWWCEVHRQGNGRTWCKEHDGCGWRLLVDPGNLQ